MISAKALEEVQAAYDRCQRCYPTVRLPFEVFLARVDRIISTEVKLSDDRSRLVAFAQLHHEDLFLALACARGDRVAWEHFADDYLPMLKRFAVQACQNFNESEDLAQEITARLLEEKERLEQYNSRGSLACWLRVAVSHAAIDRFRRTRKQVSLEELQQEGRNTEPAVADAGGMDKEGDLDSHWGPIVSRILGEEIRRLPVRGRLLLSLYYLQGVSLRTIGRHFQVHEATASRRLDSLRQGIRKRVERELRKRHGMRPGEVQSLWRWVSVSSVVGPLLNDSQPAIEESSMRGDVEKKPARVND